MGDIVQFPGVTTLDMPVDQILETAKEAKLETCIVIGLTEDGELYAASSTGDLPLAVFLTQRFAHRVHSGEYDLDGSIR